MNECPIYPVGEGVISQMPVYAPQQGCKTGTEAIE